MGGILPDGDMKVGKTALPGRQDDWVDTAFVMTKSVHSLEWVSAQLGPVFQGPCSKPSYGIAQLRG